MTDTLEKLETLPIWLASIHILVQNCMICFLGRVNRHNSKDLMIEVAVIRNFHKTSLVTVPTYKRGSPLTFPVHFPDRRKRKKELDELTPAKFARSQHDKVT